MADGSMSVAYAIWAAAAAGFFNIVVAVYNQRAQRRLERDKAAATDQLEKEKTEALRILEMIKTNGDIAMATKNLQFLTETGLISDKNMSAKIIHFVQTNGTPVLPVSNGGFRIEATDALSAASRALLQASLDEYYRYIDGLEFSGAKDSKPIVRLEYDHDMAGWLSQYDPNTGVIHIARSMQANIDSPRREYTHHVLLTERPDQDMNHRDLYLLESDLADYFVGSFGDRPELNVGTPVFRTLVNQETFEVASKAKTAWRTGREVWGGAFWAIRSKLGREVTDKVLAMAWRQMAEVSSEGDAPRKYIAALMSAAHDFGPSEAEPVIDEILKQRKFPMPSTAPTPNRRRAQAVD